MANKKGKYKLIYHRLVERNDLEIQVFYRHFKHVDWQFQVDGVIEARGTTTSVLHARSEGAIAMQSYLNAELAPNTLNGAI